MADWDDLARELDLWQLEGRCATFWWRDDDATGPTAELERALAISLETDTPINLAVIPRDTGEALRERLSRHGLAHVLQHGWSHDNHAPSGERQEEFGAHRPVEIMLGELAAGWQRIAAFDNALPVLVAPWNRLDPGLFPTLPGIGIGAVSTLGPRMSGEPVPGLRCVNVHADIIDWDGSRGFMGDHAALAQIVAHLSRRRQGQVDRDEPTGLMTHHLCHDEGCWWFTGELLRRTRSHPAVRWLDAREAFWP